MRGRSLLADSERKVILYWRFLENVEYSCWSWVDIWEVVSGMMLIVAMTESDREEVEEVEEMVKYGLKFRGRDGGRRI